MKIITELMAEMFEDCYQCHGTGRDVRLGSWCYQCHGIGRVLTDKGQELYDALEPFLKRSFAEVEHSHTIH